MVGRRRKLPMNCGKMKTNGYGDVLLNDDEKKSAEGRG